jgi:hypothetical protein
MFVLQFSGGDPLGSLFGGLFVFLILPLTALVVALPLLLSLVSGYFAAGKKISDFKVFLIIVLSLWVFAGVIAIFQYWL